VPSDARTALLTQLIVLMREDPSPETDVAQSRDERLKPRMSTTYVLEFTRRVRSEPGRAPLPSSKPSLLTSQGPSRWPAAATILARHTTSHIPPSNGSEHEDTNMADESTAPARAPSAFFNHSISPVDGSRAAILDIGQLAAVLRMAFARSLVEERHRRPRTFVEFGAWPESLQ
ncbi:hypothetical protein BD311DRAFT_665089, partial [Dichomitus squalens]